MSIFACRSCLAHDAAVFHMKHLGIRRSRRGLNTLHQWGPDNIVVDIGSMCSHNKPENCGGHLNFRDVECVHGLQLRNPDGLLDGKDLPLSHRRYSGHLVMDCTCGDSTLFFS